MASDVTTPISRTSSAGTEKRSLRFIGRTPQSLPNVFDFAAEILVNFRIVLSDTWALGKLDCFAIEQID
jgi:hypothetical protein